MRGHTILLTTFRRDGRAVPTTVSLGSSADEQYFRTWDTAAKHRRLLHNPTAMVAPATFRGRQLGPESMVRAELLHGDEARLAARALRRWHPLLHGFLVPLAHRVRGFRTVHYRLRPSAEGED